MLPISPRVKETIENFIRGKYPAFKADSWGRIDLEGSDSYKDQRYACAGWNDKERKIFSVTVYCPFPKSPDTVDVVTLFEEHPIYTVPTFPISW